MTAGMTSSGIVLAGGRSSRFGGSKLDADLAGRSVLERTIDALRGVCDHVIVVGPMPERWVRAADVRFVAEPVAFGGPAAGIATGLEAVRGPTAIVVGGDMPLVVPEVLRRLVARLGADPRSQAAVLANADWVQPLPCALDAAAARVAAGASLAGRDRSLNRFLGRLRTVDLAESDWRPLDPDRDTLLDIDTPADLERARDRINRR